MADHMSNPRISNEVLSDKIDQLIKRVEELGTTFISKDAFELKVSDINHELQDVKVSLGNILSKKSRNLNWWIPAVLNAVGLLVVYILLKVKP